MLKNKYIYLFVFAWCFIATPLLAATYTALTCDDDAVQAKMDLATSAGDIVEIPEGTCNWNQQVTWTAPAGAILRGAGTSATGGGDVTVIVDQYTSNAPLLDIDINSSGTFQMTGITIRADSDTQKDAGVIKIDGPGDVRIDHCHFDTITESTTIYKIFWIGDRVHGVMDHNIIDLYAESAIYIFNGWGTDAQGNTTWSEATNFGGADFLFIEDNQINGTKADMATRIVDIFSAGRVVIRFNDVAHSCLVETHCTGHAGDDRGSRAYEAYNNTTTSTYTAEEQPNFDMAYIDNGTAMIWGNSSNAYAYKNGVVLDNKRKNTGTYSQSATPIGWGYCGTEYNGTGSDWDQNTSETYGYRCLDMVGSGAGDLLTGSFPNYSGLSTDSKPTCNAGTNGRTYFETDTEDKYQCINPNWTLNNELLIPKLIDGESWPTGIAWSNQALEPVYIWNNTITPHPGYGGNVLTNNASNRILSDTHYYAQASGIQSNATTPFDGTTGTGWGTVADRPTTCTAGVGYWATDESILYTCGDSNDWSEYYQPFEYPHYLRSGQTVTIAGNDPLVVSQNSANLTFTWTIDSENVTPINCKWRLTDAPTAEDGTATSSLTASVTGLSEGENTVYVGCYDGSVWTNNDNITVDYQVPGTTTDASGITISGGSLQ
jgi:hypothetical protein